MKIKLLLAVMLLSAMVQTQAQERSAFRSGYLRVGQNILGDKLDPALSPQENVFAGNYGAEPGYVFEFGRIFYFGKTSSPSIINLGLDWTILSLNYNKLTKWDIYAEESGADGYEIDGTQIAAAVSSKLGPVISLNLIEKVVIDARFQLAPMLRFYDFSYYDDNGGAERSFSFTNYGQEEIDEDFDGENIKNKIAFGVAKSFGVTLRRKALGISIDYISGDVKSNYEASEGDTYTYGKEKIPAKNLQIKLNLTF